MDLLSYLAKEKKEHNRGLTALAQRASIGLSHLHDIKTGRRRPTLTVALQIEAATDGAVTPRDLMAAYEAKNGT